MTTPELWWLAEAGGAPTGPYTREHLEQVARERGAGSGAVAWRDGEAAWRPVEDVLSGRAAPRPPGAARYAMGAVSTIQAVALAGCISVMWAFGADWAPGDVIRWVWPLAGLVLIAASLAAPLMWRGLALRRGRLSESGAGLTVLIALSSIAGLGVGGFELSQAKAAVATAYATETLIFDLHVDGPHNRIVMIGTIGSGFGRRFEAALRTLPDPIVVLVESNGGLTEEALQAAHALEAREHTRVITQGQCASACLILLMAGDERIARAPMRLDVHAVDLIAGADNRLMRWSMLDQAKAASDYLTGRGLPRDMVEAADRAGPSKVLALSLGEALDTGILTGVLEGDLLLDPAEVALRFPPRRRLRAVTDPGVAP